MTSKEAIEKIEYDLGILELIRKYMYFDKKDNYIKCLILQNVLLTSILKF